MVQRCQAEVDDQQTVVYQPDESPGRPSNVSPAPAGHQPSNQPAVSKYPSTICIVIDF